MSVYREFVPFSVYSKMLGFHRGRPFLVPMFQKSKCLGQQGWHPHRMPTVYRNSTTFTPSHRHTGGSGTNAPGTAREAAMDTPQRTPNPLSRLPLPDLIRNLILTYVFASPFLTRTSISLMQRIALSKSPLLSPDRNPILRTLVKWTVYNHLAAGEGPVEVKQTVSRFKSMGYHGVIIGYGKEVIAEEDAKSSTPTAIAVESSCEPEDKSISAWLKGNLETLELLGKEDYLAIKLTGAGDSVNEALIAGRAPPTQLSETLHHLCDRAMQQKSLVWIDAEQQVFQPAIDSWTIDLMRKYNRSGKVLVSNTIQAYLKGSRENVARHLMLAQAEGWALGVKLVRGAYISSDRRERIWDTKEQTDDCYNSIVRDLISRSWPGLEGNFPDLCLFLASHNPESIRLGADAVRQLVRVGKATCGVKFGQIQGMADNVSLGLLGLKDQMEAARLNEGPGSEVIVPKVYKTLCWGSVQELMHYLVRRAVENSSACERLKDGRSEYWRELRRRIFKLT